MLPDLKSLGRVQLVQFINAIKKSVMQNTMAFFLSQDWFFCWKLGPLYMYLHSWVSWNHNAFTLKQDHEFPSMFLFSNIKWNIYIQRWCF